MGDELKWFLKDGGGRIFESCDISLKKTPTPHIVSLVLFVWHAMPFLSCPGLCSNSKWCLPSFVSPSSHTMLLPQCFLLNITVCTTPHIGVRTFERKATTSFKKGGWALLYVSRYWQVRNRWTSLCVSELHSSTALLHVSRYWQVL